jgi:Ni2+-binding GTPase involved in maturation of urease and hydrogenase
MYILHLTGTSCSGKTYIIEEFKNNPDVCIWDILDWYKEQEIIKDGKMDWDVWKRRIHKIDNYFEELIKKAENYKLLIIESSGNSTVLNRLLSDYNVDKLVLKVPSNDEIIMRAKNRIDITNELAIEFKRHYLTYSIIYSELLTYYEAGIYIKEVLNSL